MKPGTYIKDRVAALLEDGKERTYAQIVEEIRSCIPAVRTAVKEMHSRGLVHIVGWIYNRTCHHTPIYRFGPGEDLPQREPLTKSQRMKQYRKMRAERERNQRIQADRLHAIYRDPITTALFGPCKQSTISLDKIKGRVYMQPMTVEDDELEAA
jgi:hypothetical protein